MSTRRTAPNVRPAAWMPAAILVVLLGGCAYFNTFYNARRHYNTGLAREETKEGSGKTEFKRSLEKAVIVARDYPDSRWVDDALFLIAMNYYWMENYDKARVQFEGFIEHFPDSRFIEEARYYHALTLIELGKYSDGRVALQEMFSSRRFGRRARFAWAEAFKREEDWEGARRAFREFLELYPHGETAHAARLHLAEIELAGGDTLSAITTYERYVRRAETSKENYERMLTLAELYYLEGHYAAARRTLKKTKGRYTDIDQKSDLLAAKIELAEGDSARAEKLLAKIPYGDSRAEAFFILASMYELQGRYPSALAYYDTVATRERRSDYARLAERKKTLLEARIPRSDSTDTTLIDPAKEQFLLAETYFLSFADFERALEEYSKVVEEYPESQYAPKALYGMAFLRRYKLNDSLWHRDLERLMERYPQSTAAEEARSLLSNETRAGEDS